LEHQADIARLKTAKAIIILTPSGQHTRNQNKWSAA